MSADVSEAVALLEGRCAAIDKHYERFPDTADRTMEDTARAIRLVLAALQEGSGALPASLSGGQGSSAAPIPTERESMATPLKPDLGGCVTKRFVVFTHPGRVPEKKGGWLREADLIDFLRDVVLHDGWKPGFRATVLELTWNNDLWASSASEYLSMHDHATGPRRARAAWKDARAKYERIYGAPPSCKPGTEMDSFHRLIAPRSMGMEARQSRNAPQPSRSDILERIRAFDLRAHYGEPEYERLADDLEALAQPNQPRDREEG